jgi:hypothetical protein
MYMCWGGGGMRFWASDRYEKVIVKLSKSSVLFVYSFIKKILGHRRQCKNIRVLEVTAC